MFREMRRSKQALSHDECVALLKTLPRGVLSVLGEGGYPYGLPLNFYYDDTDGCLYFHSAKAGHKIDALKACDKVSFCAYDEGYRKEGAWSLNIKSVLVFGRIAFVEDQANVLEKVRLLGLKYYPTAESVEEVLARSADHLQLLKLNIEHMTGKLVNES